MSSSTVNLNVPSGQPLPITIGSDGSTFNTDTEIKIDPINLKIDPLSAYIKVEPLQLSTDSKLSTESNAVSDSKSEIDLKPMAVDSCTTLKFAPLPPLCLEQPYSQHFGITFMGMELWGFNISGKSETSLHSPSKSWHHEIPEPCGDRDQKPNPPVSRPPSGLRVRVK
jgi:hypothetical protein